MLLKLIVIDYEYKVTIPYFNTFQVVNEPTDAHSLCVLERYFLALFVVAWDCIEY